MNINTKNEKKFFVENTKFSVFDVVAEHKKYNNFEKIFLKCVFLSLFFILPNQIYSQENEITQKAFEELLQAYLSPKTEDSLRYDIFEIIKNYKKISTAKSILISALKDEKQRPHALILSRKLKISEVAKAAQKYIETDDIHLIVALIFEIRETTSLKFLYSKWKDSTSDSIIFESITKGFKTYKVNLEEIEPFCKILENIGDNSEEHKKIAIAIIQFQLNTDLQGKMLVEYFETLKKNYKLYSKKLPLNGEDLLKNKESLSLTGTEEFGENYFLKTNGSIYINLLPEHIQKGNFDLKIRVLITKKGDDAYAKLARGEDERGWKPFIRGDEWISETDKGVELASAPVKVGQWTTIVFKIMDRSTEQRRLERKCKIIIDDIVLLQEGNASGRFNSIIIKAKNAEMVVGGVEIVR